MKTIEEINAIKAKMQSLLNMRDSIDEASDIRIVVGMATCGIAAGARPVLNAFVEEITKRHLTNVKVTQSGCLGMCKLEPMVEVYMPGKEKVTYIRVTADSAKRIIAEHIVNGNPVIDFVIGNE